MLEEFQIVLPTVVGEREGGRKGDRLSSSVLEEFQRVILTVVGGREGGREERSSNSSPV